MEGTKSGANFGGKYFSRGKSEGTILMRPKIELIVYILVLCVKVLWCNEVMV